MVPGPKLDGEVRRIAIDGGLSGAVRIDVGGSVAFAEAFGFAHRGLQVLNTVDTQFATASGTKGFTALTVMSLVEDGLLGLSTPARSLLGADLPLIDDGVSVEHLLAHRSGIGDYLDEDEHTDPDDHLMPVPVHELACAEDFVRILGGHPTKFPPGDRFSYSNGGYVVLALMAERATRTPFPDLVAEKVFDPAGMTDSGFLRSDGLPGRAALGYLHDEGLTTNVLHLPVRGTGDGGAYTTLADVSRFWEALTAGRIVSDATRLEMVTAHSDVAEMSLRYGLGFWLDPAGDAVSIHGFDAGVGFVSVHDPARAVTCTVMCNQTRGAWPCSQRLGSLLAD